MLRPLTLAWIGLVISLAVAVFQVEFRVEGLRAELTEINRQLEEDQQAIHVLKAEWAFLTYPDRIRTAAAKHLKTESAGVQQIARIEDIPLRPVVVASGERSSEISNQ